MPRLPDGDPAPESGELPNHAITTLADGRFGIYLHVPYCSVRCGYCDFNTYTLSELGQVGGGHRVGVGLRRHLGAGRQSEAPPDAVDAPHEVDPALRHRVIVGRPGGRQWARAPTARR